MILKKSKEVNWKGDVDYLCEDGIVCCCTYSEMGRLNHADIVGSIANSADSQFRVFLHQFHNTSLLRATASKQ